MVEGRPKRACADGIDYAWTDQVPGWTTTQKMVTEGAKNPSTPSKKSTPSSTGKLHTTPGKQQNAGGSAKKKDESQLGMTTIQTTTQTTQTTTKEQQQQQQP